MKAKVIEYDEGFQISFEAENVAEAAVLIRMGLNCSKTVPQIYSYVNSSNKIGSEITFNSVKQKSSFVERKG